MNSIGVATTFAGRPTIVAFALPSNGVFVVTLQTICVFCPCSAAERSCANTTNGGAISTVNNCDDTHNGPLLAAVVGSFGFGVGPPVAVATAMNAVFHLRGAAFGAAFVYTSASVAPSGMTV